MPMFAYSAALTVEPQELDTGMYTRIQIIAVVEGARHVEAQAL